MIFRIRGTEYLKSLYDEAKRFGLTKEMEFVLGAVWAINMEIQIYAYPEPRLFSWRGLNITKMIGGNC